MSRGQNLGWKRCGAIIVVIVIIAMSVERWISYIQEVSSLQLKGALVLLIPSLLIN